MPGLSTVSVHIKWVTHKVVRVFSERNVAFVDAFLALHLTGAVLFLLIILSTVLLPGGKRHPIFFSFCLSWIVFGLSYSFLLLCGQQFKRPTRIVCTIQAALIYSSPLL